MHPRALHCFKSKKELASLNIWALPSLLFKQIYFFLRVLASLRWIEIVDNFKCIQFILYLIEFAQLFECQFKVAIWNQIKLFIRLTQQVKHYLLVRFSGTCAAASCGAHATSCSTMVATSAHWDIVYSMYVCVWMCKSIKDSFKNAILRKLIVIFLKNIIDQMFLFLCFF